MTETTVFASRFRGFENIEIPLNRSGFLVGDNSSGKTSLLLLVEHVLAGDLTASMPRLNDDITQNPFDFFSPFFENADVSIGFHIENDEGSVLRAVTISRPTASPPRVVRFTYCADGLALTVRRGESSHEVRVVRRTEPFSRVELQILHDDGADFAPVDVPDGPDQTTLAYMAASRADPDLDNDPTLMRAIFTAIDQGARHIGPLRGRPERFYAFERRYRPTGSHFAAMFNDLDHHEDATGLSDAINRFGQAAGLFDRFEADPLAAGVEDSPLVVTVTRKGQKFNLSQVGVGVSQIAPILVESLFLTATGRQDVLLIEQPELHLHPKAQAAFGDFLFEMHEQGLVTLVETHSDFMIDRYRARVRKSETSSPSNIYFCQSSSTGNSVGVIGIGLDGALEGATEEYSEFFVNELARTMF